MANVLETIGKKLEPGEKVLHQYRIISDGNDGFLVLTNQTIRFLKQKGFFRAKYQVSLEIPYQHLKDFYASMSHRLVLETPENKYNFVSIGDLTADIIVQEVKDIKKHISQS
jgi:hypothetical protein